MNTAAVFKAAGHGGDAPGIPGRSGWQRDQRGPAASTALWVFMAMVTSLFSLFIMAYAMRMDSADWHRIGMPWQLWLATALLAAGSLALQRAKVAARDADWTRARTLFLAGGGFALAFIGVQLWGWQALLAMRVVPAGNPAGSFFYLLTAMHGLHVAGGLAAWGLAARRAWHSGLPSDPRILLAIALCARYWHFLLALWVVLFAVLGWLTPEAVRFICGRA